jgi:hypothetical protein
MAGSDFIFTVAVGKLRYYSELPAADDSLIYVLLKSAGLEADSTLRDYDTLAALLAASNDEADFTGYTRTTLSTPVHTEDETNNRWDLDTNDFQYATATAGNTCGKGLVCYKPASASADSAIIPLAAYNLTLITDGNPVNIAFNASGYARAAAS